MSAWDQSQAAIFNLGPGVSTQSHVFTQSHVLRNPCLGPVPSSHFQLGTSPMLSIIPTWDRSHVGILTSNYNLQTWSILLFHLFDLIFLYQAILGDVVQSEGPPHLLVQWLVGEIQS